MGGLMLFCVSIAHSRTFIMRQMRQLFLTSYSSEAGSETSDEKYFQYFLVVLSCLLMAIIVFLYSIEIYGSIEVVDHENKLIAIFFTFMMGYHMTKWTLYRIVNGVFFNRQQCNQWEQTLLFINSLECALILPTTLTMVYFGFSLQSGLSYFLFLLILVKLLTIYKAWNIFFKQNGGFLQIILYFCTLEIVPITILAVSMLTLVIYLNFIF